MEKAFKKAKADHDYKSSKMTSSARLYDEEAQPINSSNLQSTKQVLAEKRIRHIDRLDRPSTAPKLPTTISDTGQDLLQRDNGTDRRPADREMPPDSVSPEKQVHEETSFRRTTRSQESKEGIWDQQTTSGMPPKSSISTTKVLGEAWSNDLVYPGPGKRSATVPFEDLRRLDDDEFLNDNLIAFFMKYLETHMEKTDQDLYRRTHFFNTYFYEALTKTSKGKKGINYDAVSKWTKNINIFKRDFVVVPVNENFHWYLAIICNLSSFLPKLEGEKEEQGDQDLQEIDRFEPERTDVEQQPDRPTEEPQRSMAELSISDTEMAYQNSPKAASNSQPKRGHGRHKAAGRSLQKYEIDKPVIITLDSLGLPRSATCSTLKQYVAAEAADKLGLDIDPTEVRGMTAKEIPTQSNFSDCGLYLCMYLEQFVTDPDKFVYRILQREGNAQQWPQRVRSEDLRSRLRDLILELHRRQEKQKPAIDIPEIGSIMMENRKLAPDQALLRKPQTKQDIEEARLRFQSILNGQELVDDGLSPAPQQRTARTSRRYLVETSHTSEDGRPLRNTHLQSQQRSREEDGRSRSSNTRQPNQSRMSSHADMERRGEESTITGDQGEGRRSSKRQRTLDSDMFEKPNVRSHSASRDFLSGLESSSRRALSPPSPVTGGHRVSGGLGERSDDEIGGERDFLRAGPMRRRMKRKSRRIEHEEPWSGFDSEVEVAETRKSDRAVPEKRHVHDLSSNDFVVYSDFYKESFGNAGEGEDADENGEMLLR